MLKIIQNFKTAIAEPKTKHGAFGAWGQCECTVTLSGCSVAPAVCSLHCGKGRERDGVGLGEAGTPLRL